MNKAYIKALANYIPEKMMTNEDFAATLETSNEWILTRTGIEQRHIAAEDETTLDMGMKVLENLKKQGINLDDVDGIIVPTTTKDYPTPSTSALIQNALGLKNCFSLDLSAACSGYVYSINTATALIESGVCTNVLVIAIEKITKDVNWNDRSTAILFGDAATVALLSKSNDDSGVIAMDMQSRASDILIVPSSGTAIPISVQNIEDGKHFIHMQGSETFKIAVTEFCNSIEKTLKEANMSMDDISCFIPHQANIRIIQYVAKKTGFPYDKIEIILNKYGNTSSASIGLALTEAYHSGKIKKGDNILFTAFGAGLTWGSTLIRW